MIKPESKEILKNMLATQHGRALEEFLLDELESIGDITQAKNWEDVVGRQYYVKSIEKLFALMGKTKLDKRKHNQYT